MNNVLVKRNTLVLSESSSDFICMAKLGGQIMLSIMLCRPDGFVSIVDSVIFDGITH